MSTRKRDEQIWAIDNDDEFDLDAADAYEYALDEAKIAAVPAKRRDDARLLVYRGADESIEHRRFGNLLDELREGDLLVFNNTRVVPARVEVFKETGGRVELFVLAPAELTRPQEWKTAAREDLVFECMTRSSKPLRKGAILADPKRPDLPPIEIVTAESGRATVRIKWQRSALEFLEEFGVVPLPPYIVRRREESGARSVQKEDVERYQTVYASTPGAVAAPTAGLHFTRELLDNLDDHGVRRAEVTLTVGPGTFRPVRHDRLSEHEMHSEDYFIPEDLSDAIADCRRRGGRVIAVGTTSARALEAEARRDNPFVPGWRSTDLFLKPGRSFRICDGLITNFHLPRSTLLALVACFVGYDGMRRIYEAALHEGYRFYSYGDSSLLFRPQTKFAEEDR